MRFPLLAHAALIWACVAISPITLCSDQVELFVDGLPVEIGPYVGNEKPPVEEQVEAGTV